MSKAKQKILGFLIILVAFFSIASVVEAGNMWDMQEGFNNNDSVAKVFTDDDKPQDVRVTIAKVIRFFLGFLGIIFLVLTIYAGFLWMTASGNESKVEESKKILSRSIIGMIIILTAYSITAFVMCRVIDATQDNPFSCII